jgi:pimeloyl-ACP methyl ester carboxylesterase
MGGYITLAFVDKYSENAAAFGLFHSSAFPDNEEKKDARQKNIDFVHKHSSLDFLKQAIPNLFGELFKKNQPDFINNFIDTYKEFDPEALIDYTRAMMHRPDRTNILKMFKKPVLFIAGKHDNAVPFEQTMKQVHLPQLSYIHILEDSGHMGMIEEPEKSTAFLEAFVKAVYD